MRDVEAVCEVHHLAVLYVNHDKPLHSHAPTLTVKPEGEGDDPLEASGSRSRAATKFFHTFLAAYILVVLQG